MDCAVCGNPLLFDRVAFHCSCGVYVHSYCWDKHVLEAHRPAFEIGTIDINSEFKPIETQKLEETSNELPEAVTEEQTPEL
ncbi:MAG: hypothetical protein U9R04_06445 [Chloroflexota bacterium]|nr:hypothetical protein [Chloroflexota bacterium]